MCLLVFTKTVCSFNRNLSKLQDSCPFLPLNHLLDDFFPEQTDIREIVHLYVRCELTDILDLPGVADNLDHHLLLHHPLRPGKKYDNLLVCWHALTLRDRKKKRNKRARGGMKKIKQN